MIGATTLTEYRQGVENRDAALMGRFRPVLVERPDVLLLQISAAGRLTDGQGRTVDFKNSIIMTSNIGARAIHNAKPWC